MVGMAVVIATSVPSCAGGSNDSTANPKPGESGNTLALSAHDREFATKAAEHGLREIELARIAVSRATTEPVKSYAQMLIDDHEEAQEQLENLTRIKHLDLRPRLDKEYEADKNRLQQLEWAEFDATYVSMMIADHEVAIDLFSHTADEAQDAELRRWASSTLPKLQHHLQRATELRQSSGRIGVRVW